LNSQSILAGFGGQGVVNKDPAVWLDGARPPSNAPANNFELKMNLSFAKEYTK